MKSSVVQSLKSLALTALLASSVVHAQPSKVIMTCETLSKQLDSSFAIYDHDARHFRVEWIGSDHPVDGWAPLFSGLVSKNTLVRLDTGGSLISEDPHRVKIEVDLRTGKGRMKYYKWRGYTSSLFSATADLKLEADVVCVSK